MLFFFVILFICRCAGFFTSVSSQEIRTLHKPLQEMMSKSRSFCRALTVSGLFVSSVVKRLKNADALVLRSLLKMIQLLHQNHPNPRQFVLDNGLYNILKGYTRDESQVVVYQIAVKLIRDMQLSTLT